MNRSPFVQKIGLAVVATVIGLATAGGIWLGPGNPPVVVPPPPPVAGHTTLTGNLWLEPDGAATCTRQSTPIPEPSNHALACGTPHAAYQAAALDDTVAVGNGTYPADTITNDATKLAPCTAGYVHFVGRPDGVAWFQNIQVNNARCIEFDGNSLTNQDSLAQSDLLPATSGLTFKTDPAAVRDYCQTSIAGCPNPSTPYPYGEGLDVRNCGEYVIASYVDMTYLTVTHGQQIQIIGGSLGGHTGTSSDSVLQPAFFPTTAYPFADACPNYNANHITMSDMVIHDAYGGASTGAHPDCLQMSGATDIDIQRVSFVRCETSDVLARPAYNIWCTGCGPAAGGTTGVGALQQRFKFVNDFFGPLTESGNIILWGGGTDHCGDIEVGYSTLVSINVGGSGCIQDQGTVSLHDDIILSTTDAFHCNTWNANLGGGSINNLAFVGSVGCGTNQKLLTSAAATVVNPGSDWASCPAYARCPVSAGSFKFDYHLVNTGSGATMINAGIGTCPTLDFDAGVRTVPCDMGGDEYGVTAGTSGTGGQGMVAGQSTFLPVTVGSYTSRYYAYKPTTVNGQPFNDAAVPQGVPLVVVLHGSSPGSCDSLQNTSVDTYQEMIACVMGTDPHSDLKLIGASHWPEKCDVAGCIVVFPVGYWDQFYWHPAGNPANFNRSWGNNVNTADLIKSVVQLVETSQTVGANIDPTKVYLTGFSSGAIETTLAFCQEPPSASGIANFDSTFNPPASLDDFSGVHSIQSLFAGFAPASGATFQGFVTSGHTENQVQPCSYPAKSRFVIISSRGDGTQPTDPGQSLQAPLCLYTGWPVLNAATGQPNICTTRVPFEETAFQTQYSCGAEQLSTVPMTPAPGTTNYTSYAKHVLPSCANGTQFQWLSLGASGTAGPTHGYKPYNDAMGANGGETQYIWSFWTS